MPFSQNLSCFCFRRLIGLILLTSCPLLQSQNTYDLSLQRLLEHHAEQYGEDGLSDSDISEIERLCKTKINLNTATDNELSYFFTDFQLLAIRKYIETFGAIRSVYELYSIHNMDTVWLDAILPFFDKEPADREEKWWKTWNKREFGGELLSRYRTDFKHYPTPKEKFQGGNYALGERLSLHYGRFVQMGILAKKDIGEEFFTGSQKQGFDHYSGYLSIEQFGLPVKLILGDYRLQFGQGLTMWQGFSPRFLSDTWLKKQPRRAIPHTSFSENNFMRGLAAQWQSSRWSFTSFYSNRKRDGALSLQETGLHRTLSEIKYKDTRTEEIVGGNLSWEIPHLHIGTTAFHVQYSDSINPKPNYYNQYAFRGSENWNVGIDFSTAFQSYLAYGEWAWSPQGKAGLLGMQWQLPFGIQASSLYHFYAKDYQNLYAQAIGANSLNQNERGICFGIERRFFSNLTLAALADFHTYPWKMYNVNAENTQSSRYKITATWKPRPRHQINLSFQGRMREQNQKDPLSKKTLLGNVTKNTLRGNYTYKPTARWKLVLRGGYTTYDGIDKQTAGYVLSEDIIYTAKAFPLFLSLRCAIFSAADFASACYLYEQDMPLMFSIPAYAHSGHRMYVFARYHVGRRCSICLKYACWVYAEREQIPYAHELKAQLQWLL